MRPTLLLIFFVSSLLTAQNTLVAAEQIDWQVSMATLWGKQGNQELKAVVVNNDGLVIAGGNGGAAVPAPITNTIGTGGDGVLIVYDPDLSTAVSLTLLPGSVRDMDLTPEGDLLVAAGGSIYRLSPDGSELRWQAPGSGRIASDGEGGVWMAHKKTIRHLDATGKETISFSAGTGWGCKDITYEPQSGHVVVCGSRSARGPVSRYPVHIPWIFAYDRTGKHVWTAYNFPAKDIEANADMADSHVQRLVVNSQGKVFFSGDAEGGNTPYRHDTLIAGGKTDANNGTALGGEMWKAFNSTRVLYIGQLHAETGAIERGTYFYGKHMNLAKKREELGDADVYGLHADDDGRVYLSGVIRTKPPWTKNAVHKEHGPIEITGRWKHLIGPDEAFLAIFSPGFDKLEFCSGFAQGATTRYASRGLAVGGNGSVAAIAGWTRQPRDFKEHESASETTYLRSALQSTYGLGTDGYLAVLSPQSSSPPLPSHLTRSILKRRFTAPSDLVSQALTAKSVGSITEQLQNGEESEQLAAQLILSIGASQLKRAQDMTSSKPFLALEYLSDISTYWSGSAVSVAAEQATTDLKADPLFQERLAASELLHTIMELQDSMRDARGAKKSSYTDPAYFRTNSSRMKRMKKTFNSLQKDFPKTPEVSQARMILSNLDIPTTEEEEKMVKILQVVIRASWAIKTRPGMKPSYKDKKFKKLNQKAIEAIQVGTQKLVAESPEHPYTLQAIETAHSFAIPTK